MHSVEHRLLPYAASGLWGLRVFTNSLGIGDSVKDGLHTNNRACVKYGQLQVSGLCPGLHHGNS